VVDARIQRLKRAMDLSMKHQYLPEHLQVRAPSFPLDLDLDSYYGCVVVTVASEVALDRF
jgi:ubiquinol-cytochrome c reductase subunit 7